MMSESEEMERWTPLPASIVRVELHSERPRGATSRVTAEYTYDFEGKAFHGRRIAIAPGHAGDALELYANLERHHRKATPTLCYVDASKPERSILLRELHPSTLVLKIAFIVVLGGLGCFMVYVFVDLVQRVF